MLGALREAARQTALYPEHADEHPLGAGYRMIAMELQGRLPERDLKD